MNNTPSARKTAFDALMQMDENEGYSNIVIDKAIKRDALDKRDSALSSTLFYGVLEKRICLDKCIAAYLDKPQYSLSTAVANILRLAVYQLFYLDKIPESAAVNEAVNLAKKSSKQADFVNAVLRSMLRDRSKADLVLASDDWSVRYSVPDELTDMWKEAYGEANTREMLESFLEKSRTWIRINDLKTNREEFIDSYDGPGEVYPYSHLKNACLLNNAGNPAALKEFEEGLFHVQDISSQYLCLIVDPKAGENVIDMCSAPGGKTFTISQMMKGEGKVYAYDLYKGRVGLIRSGAYRLGLPNVLASVRDATDSKCEINNADRILCDVPCSGFGTIRRKPEIRYKSLASLETLPELQYKILSCSSAFLKPGGMLYYSTCTLNPKENGNVADKFLAEHPDFEAVEIKIPMGIKRSVDEPDNQFTMMPYSGDTDGFFVASFRRKQ